MKTQICQLSCPCCGPHIASCIAIPRVNELEAESKRLQEQFDHWEECRKLRSEYMSEEEIKTIYDMPEEDMWKISLIGFKANLNYYEKESEKIDKRDDVLNTWRLHIKTKIVELKNIINNAAIVEKA